MFPPVHQVPTQETQRNSLPRDRQQRQHVQQTRTNRGSKRLRTTAAESLDQNGSPEAITERTLPIENLRHFRAAETCRTENAASTIDAFATFVGPPCGNAHFAVKC